MSRRPLSQRTDQHMKRYLTVFLAAAFVSTAAIAQTAPEAVVKSAVQGTVEAMKADPQARGGDMKKINDLVEAHFVPATNFQRTTRIAVGKAWTTATPDQQKQLYEQFQVLLVRTYASSLSQLRGQDVKFQFQPANVQSSGNDAVVTSHGGDDQVDYRLEKTANGWKIYDINMLGAWLIQVYQTQFQEQLSKGGVDGLIKFLTEHNARNAG
jgi:phospholipid transport system substrate-binding protein